ncbi:dihydrodipicolinate synthase family protein [Actinoplanes sp. GCM10030250]|uniref:dihydrodipicolinate synthase family protein n=1 Tax=Actinoplanes sp. GCM10030250 TaxID=3273376 RepID=UPI00361E9822
MRMNGVWVPMITPFDDGGEVALPVLERLAVDLLEAGAAGLVALGTTGEPASLSDAERRKVLDLTSQIGAPLIAGANTVAQLRELPGGVAAALTLVPPFLRPGEDGVVAHFEALAAASPVPLVVYHVPYRSGQALTAGALRRLAAIDGVIGVKYAPGALDAQAMDLLADPPPGCAVLCGDDVLLSPMLALGAAGAIAASAHLATASFAELASLWQAGDATRARPLGHRLARLSAALFAEPNPSVIKGALHAAGRIPTPDVRLPLLAARTSTVDEVAPYLYGSLLE